MLKKCICQNPNCHRGKNQSPKEFVICVDCSIQPPWKAQTCCVQCYQELMLEKLNRQTEERAKTV